MLKKLAAIGFVVVAVAGCSDKQRERFNDAPRGVHNDESADTGSMPDGFSNFASKCDHGNRVYVIFKGDGERGAIDVVPQDPSCDE